MSDEREYLLRQAMTILHGARAACDAAVVLIGAAQSDSAEPDEEHNTGDTDRDPMPVDLPPDWPSSFGAPGMADARTRHQARHRLVDVPPLSRERIRADTQAANSRADATGAAHDSDQPHAE